MRSSLGPLWRLLLPTLALAPIRLRLLLLRILWWSGRIPDVRIFELRCLATSLVLLIHVHIVVGWLVLMIVVPLVLEMILDLLWHMVVLEGSKPAKSLMSGLRWLLFVLTTAESVDN